jgi:hypothetical protein
MSGFAKLRARRAVSYLATAVVAGAVTGGGWALAAGDAGAIHACSSKKTGALRLARRCRRRERVVTWNVQGPGGINGINGINGADGANGANGQPGPSNAFSGGLPGPIAITTAIGPGDKVGHLNLASGSYVIFAKAWLENQSSSLATTATCELDAGSDSDRDVLKLEPAGANSFRGAVALHVAHTFASPGTAQLSCATGAGVSVTANDVVVTAIQVGNLTGGALIAG